MRIIVAGASGAIGRQLVPMLAEAGHTVAGLTRSESKTSVIEAAGAEPIVADVLDAEAVKAAVRAARPEVVVHELTAIPPVVNPRRFAEEFAPTNRLRREGTRNLVAAALAAGSRRIVAQSIAQAYAPRGGWIKAELDPLYGDAPPVFRETFQAVIDLEATVLGASGLEAIVLRYGNFYGPGTAYGREGSNAELVRRQMFPIAGEGSAHWSFIHVRDAAHATVMAVSRGEPGVYNIVDDEPAAVADWLPVYAAALGAAEPPRTPPPRSPYGAYGMLLARGASNAKAKRLLGWAPRYATWREGFPDDLRLAPDTGSSRT
jgi:nucleoside-diphosphate-sugar epimerase